MKQQRDGLMVYGPEGKPTRFRRWVVRWLLFPLAVRRGTAEDASAPK